MEGIWKRKIILIFHDVEKKQDCDLEVPSDLTANEFVHALNQGLNLGIDTKDISQCYLKSTNPIALLRGNKNSRNMDCIMEQIFGMTVNVRGRLG